MFKNEHQTKTKQKDRKMKMIEMHLIQSVPASNINRGEDGDPKTATFGGTLRHRVSSQCWKRAIRTNIQEHYKNNSENYGILSKEYSDYIKTLCPTVDPKLVESHLKTLEILPKNDKNSGSSVHNIKLSRQVFQKKKTAPAVGCFSSARCLLFSPLYANFFVPEWGYVCFICQYYTKKFCF